jgi:phosphoribosylformylglycinamidine cyclo-ligase
VLPPGARIKIDLAAFHCQPVFHWLAKAGNVEQAEMLRTFNCGVGFVAVVAPHDATAVAACFHDHGEEAFPIGMVERHVDDMPAVRFTGKLGASE